MRAAIAAALLALLAVVLDRSPARSSGRRDLALAGFAVAVGILGVFAVLGPLPGLVAAAVILAAFLVGGLVYGLLALLTRWAGEEE